MFLWLNLTCYKGEMVQNSHLTVFQNPMLILASGVSESVSRKSREYKLKLHFQVSVSEPISLKNELS